MPKIKLVIVSASDDNREALYLNGKKVIENNGILFDDILSILVHEDLADFSRKSCSCLPAEQQHMPATLKEYQTKLEDADY